MAQDDTDFRAMFDGIIGTFGFRRHIDNIMHGTGGGLNRAAYGYPNNGDVVYIPSTIITNGVRLYMKYIVVNCGEHTFDAEELRIKNDPNDEEIDSDMRLDFDESENTEFDDENEVTEIDDAE